MGVKLFILVAGTAGAFGIACGYFLRWLISIGKKGSVELRIKQMELEAQENAKRVVDNAEKIAAKTADDAKRMEREKEQTWKKTEERFINKEDMLDKRQTALEQEFEGLRKKAEEVRAIKERVLALDGEKRKEIERVAGMSLADAKTELFSVLERAHEEDIAVQMHKLEKFGVERLERRGREILTAAIHRLGNSVASDVLTTAVSIPNDEVKGKIIGKEGRNIRSFERVAGVELIVDDTPGSVIISAFDPVRRQIARVALENLILDGRIQPVKIEDSVVKAKEEIGRIIKEKGEQAAYECGVVNLDPKLVSVLGRLYCRTRYGQNVLQHSIEMAH
ncbi:MAG: DUF3552 domain-containing protein, partial [Parcubacteria group bacterium]|nr:DUF3552 domain-containing protein [Parcubacteria group bacterium]